MMPLEIYVMLEDLFGLNFGSDVTARWFCSCRRCKWLWAWTHDVIVISIDVSWPLSELEINKERFICLKWSVLEACASILRANSKSQKVRHLFAEVSNWSSFRVFFCHQKVNDWFLEFSRYRWGIARVDASSEVGCKACVLFNVAVDVCSGCSTSLKRLVLVSVYKTRVMRAQIFVGQLQKCWSRRVQAK